LLAFLLLPALLLQASVVMGEVGVALRDADVFALDVLSSHFNSFGGVLFDKLRTREGLAYSVAGESGQRQFDVPSWHKLYDHGKVGALLKATEHLLQEYDSWAVQLVQGATPIALSTGPWAWACLHFQQVASWTAHLLSLATACLRDAKLRFSAHLMHLKCRTVCTFLCSFMGQPGRPQGPLCRSSRDSATSQAHSGAWPRS
jgi:hypothetical protein